MSDINLTDTRENESAMSELKQHFQLFLMYRRYHKMRAGELPWEVKVAALFGNASLKRSIQILNARVVLSWRRFIKRTLDIVISAPSLILGAPLFAIIGIAIKLDSKGPVFFKQTRVGMRGKNFNMIKFRTMQQDAEAKTGPVWAAAQDSRVTKLGSFLRKTHLDELPQFFNVLCGEMSVVGPRPERPHFVRELRKVIPHYDRRLYAKPGITGLAQIKRQYDETIEDVKKKVRYDVLYIRKMCPVLDMMVLGMTVKSVVFGTGR